MKASEYNKLLALSKQYECLCFDLFDTLLLSKYSRRYLFIKFANYLMDEYHVFGTLTLLAANLEKLFDIDANQAIKDLFYHYGIDRQMDFESFSTKCWSYFFRLDSENLFVAPHVEELLAQLSAMDKKLILVTDYYFNKAYIVSLLNYFQINFFCQLYVSFEEKTTKQSGGLYAKISTRPALMVGDSLHSDVLMARAQGLDAFHLDARDNYKRYRRFDDSFASKKLIYRLWNFSVRQKKFFSCNYIFIVFEFCQKLYRELLNGDCVFFLAREGQFLKKCFDEYLKYVGNRKDIGTEYLYVSRLALFNATCNTRKVLPSEITEVLRQYTEWQISDLDLLLRVLGFSNNETRKLYDDYTITDKSLDGLDFSRLWRDSTFQNLLSRKRNNARLKLLKSLKRSPKRVVIVESGARGTTQNGIATLIDNAYPIVGYYIGLWPGGGEAATSRKRGLIWEYSNDYLDKKRSIDFSIFEGLLRADHGLITSLGDKEAVIEDASIFVFREYSAIRQEKMFAVFQKLCILNQSAPIDQMAFFSLRRRVCKISSESLFYDRYYSSAQEKYSVAQKSIRYSLWRESVRRIKRCVIVRRLCSKALQSLKTIRPKKT